MHRCATRTRRFPICRLLDGHRHDGLALLELLGSQDVIDRRLAALTLGQIGPAASEAVPLLEDALGDADGVLRQFAVEALLKIETQEPESLAA